MKLGSRIFVALLFTVIGLSFWAVTLQLYFEFAHGLAFWPLPRQAPALTDLANSLVNHEQETWFLLLTHYSDLFLFFPVFGVVALIAFYTPACAMVDMYWNTAHLPDDQRISYAKFRFIVGFVILALLSVAASNFMLQGTERALWQLQPSALQSDTGQGCSSPQDCQRTPFVSALKNIQIASRNRVTLADLGRNCGRDWFVQPPQTPRPDRFCPVMTNLESSGREAEGKWTSDPVCCRAQQVFDAALKRRTDDPNNRSATNALQVLTWPFYIFFLFTLLMISGLLAFRRERIEKIYGAYIHAIDRGVMIGAIAMVPLPLMHNGFLLTTNLLHGSSGATSLHRMPETFSVAFGLWALLIILSFLHPANKQAEIAARILGVIASIVFALKASTATDYTIYWFGAGAGALSLATMAGLAILLLAILIILRRGGAKKTATVSDEQQPAAPTPATATDGG